MFVSSLHSVEGVWRYLQFNGLDRIESHAFLVLIIQKLNACFGGIHGQKEKICFTESQLNNRNRPAASVLKKGCPLM